MNRKNRKRRIERLEAQPRSTESLDRSALAYLGGGKLPEAEDDLIHIRAVIRGGAKPGDTLRDIAKAFEVWEDEYVYGMASDASVPGPANDEAERLLEPVEAALVPVYARMAEEHEAWCEANPDAARWL